MGHAELGPEDIDEKITPLRGAIKRTWHAFCKTTSIHGLKFTNDQSTNAFVRFIWMVITLFMFLCSVAMVIKFYMNYRSNPTRMNVENNHAPVASLLFPAVTICPEILVNRQKAKQFLSSLKLPPTKEPFENVIDKLNLLYGFIEDAETVATADMLFMDEVLSLNNISIVELIKNVNWNCSEILFRCRFHFRIVDCEKLFKGTLSDTGHCCSFNLNETGIPFTGLHARPGIHDGLSVIVYYNDTNNNNAVSFEHGFKLLINEHAMFPSSHSVSRYLPVNEEAFISIRPTETFCSLAVEALSIAERRCVLPHEEQLKYFDLYVGTNCEVNCRAWNMVKFCGCITYFFDSNRTNDRICTFKDISCLIKNFGSIVGRYRATQCKCPHVCEKIDYNVQSSSTVFDLDIPTVDKFYDGLKNDYSVLHVFMKSQVYRRVRRDLLANMVTLVFVIMNRFHNNSLPLRRFYLVYLFLANLGGAFSLFLGMSLVSIVEIIYYFTVILNKNYKLELKARKKLFEKRTAKVDLLKY